MILYPFQGGNTLPFLASLRRGFNLIELLIAIGLTGIVIAGALGVVTIMGQKNKTFTSQQQLQQELQMTMRLIVQNIRPAGYWSQASTAIGSGQNNNPFMAPAVNLVIRSDNSCILFAYDRQRLGKIPPIGNSNDERYGYRLMNNILQFRPSGTPFNCQAAFNQWQNLTDPEKIRIQKLSFVKNEQLASPHLMHRQITITIQGYLPQKPDIKYQLTKIVALPNNQFIVEKPDAKP